MGLTGLRVEEEGLGVRLRCFGVKVEDPETGELGFGVIGLGIEVIVFAVGWVELEVLEPRGLGLGVELEVLETGEARLKMSVVLERWGMSFVAE